MGLVPLVAVVLEPSGTILSIYHDGSLGFADARRAVLLAHGYWQGSRADGLVKPAGSREGEITVPTQSPLRIAYRHQKGALLLAGVHSAQDAAYAHQVIRLVVDAARAVVGGDFGSSVPDKKRAMLRFVLRRCALGERAEGMAGGKLRSMEWAVSGEDAEPMDDGPSEAADLTPIGWAKDEYPDALPPWPEQQAGIGARASADNPSLGHTDAVSAADATSLGLGHTHGGAGEPWWAADPSEAFSEQALHEHYRAEQAWVELSQDEQEERARQVREQVISGELPEGEETGAGAEESQAVEEGAAAGADQGAEEESGTAPFSTARGETQEGRWPSPNSPSPLPDEHVVRQLVGRRARARAILWLSQHVVLHASAGNGTAFRVALRGGVRAMSQLAREAKSGGAVHTTALQALLRWAGDEETLAAVHVEAEREDSAALLSAPGIDTAARPRWLVDAPTEAATPVLRFTSKSLPLGPWGSLVRVSRRHRVRGSRLDLVWRVTVDGQAVTAVARGTAPRVKHFRLQQDLKLPSAPQTRRADPPCSDESADRVEWRVEGDVALPLFAALTGPGVTFRAQLTFAPESCPSAEDVVGCLGPLRVRVVLQDAAPSAHTVDAADSACMRLGEGGATEAMAEQARQVLRKEATDTLWGPVALKSELVVDVRAE